MNQKVLKYVLAILVCFVWGMIALNFFNAFDDKEVILKTAVSTQKNTDPYHITDSFSLLGNYSDPFSEVEVSEPVIPDSIISETTVQTPIANPEIIDISHIKYLGMIVTDKRKRRMAVINVNGAEALVREKDRFDQIYIQTITPLNITIRYKKKQFTINRISSI